ncbi:MAG: MFS transporter [Thermaerobacter sp.]|nr:MFS transporter [Thermaerobacter sp.]
MLTLFRGTFSSLREPSYRSLWFLTLVSNTAQWAFTMAIGWESYTLTHSSLWVGATIFASLAPNLLGAPVAGVLADRMDRRHLILTSLVAASFTTAVIAAAVASGALSPLLTVLLTLVLGTAGAVTNVSLNALLPTLVPKRHLLNAISLQGVAQRGTEFIGPALTTPLLATAGPASAFLLGAALYGASAFFLRGIGATEPLQRGVGTGLLRPLREGFQYIRGLPGVRTVVGVAGYHCALTMAYIGILPQFVNQTLSSGSGAYSLLVALVGLGAIIGTLSLAPITDERLRGRIYLGTAILSGLSLTALGAGGPETAAVAIILIGASQAMFITLSLAYIQRDVAEAIRGRLVSAFLVVTAGLQALANWLYGLLAGGFRPASLMLVLGVAFVVVVAGYILRSKVFRQIYAGLGLEVAPAAASLPSTNRWGQR